MADHPFWAEFERWKQECKVRDRAWIAKYGRPDPKVARERLQKIIAELEASMTK